MRGGMTIRTGSRRSPVPIIARGYEQVAATIGEALKHADAGRIQPCTNCGMAPLSRAVAVGKLKALGAGAALARRLHS